MTKRIFIFIEKQNLNITSFHHTEEFVFGIGIKGIEGEMFWRFNFSSSGAKFVKTKTKTMTELITP